MVNAAPTKTPRRFNLVLLLPLVMAVGLLVVALRYARTGAQAPSRAPVADLEARLTRPDSTPYALDGRRLDDIEAKVAALEADAAKPSSPLPRASSLRHPSQQERAAKIEEDFRIHQELVSSALSSPRVEPWASAMEKKVDEGFKAGAIDMPGGKYQGTSCRSDSCVVKVAWPSISVAQSGMMALMAITSPSGCARRVALPPPDRVGDSGLESDVILDCKKKTEPPL